MLALNRRKPFGTVHGVGEARFEQDGVLFDAGEKAIGGPKYEQRLAEMKARETADASQGCPACKDWISGEAFECADCGTAWKLVTGFPQSRWVATQKQAPSVPTEPTQPHTAVFEFPEPTEVIRLPDAENFDDLSQKEIENALKHFAVEFNPRAHIETKRKMLREKMAEEGML